ncbi:hypothetical protein [Shewanella xiamenensis]|uniref:hypothetical protein n=1 Tax=Shewanella xiamenensis TaxID=332186 RepID=UPI002E7B1912|nr:hypothetical protein [Shewanella xiamenensis]
MKIVNSTFDLLVILFITSLIFVYPVKVLTGMALYPIFLILTLIAGFSLFIFEKNKMSKQSMQTIFFILFGCSVLIFLSLCQESQDIRVILLSIFYFVFIPALFFFISKKISSSGYKILVNTIIVSSIICGIFGLLQYVFKFTFIPAPVGISLSEKYFRPISFFSSTQQFAVFMLFAFCLSIINNKSKKISVTVFLLGSLSLSMAFFFGSIFFVFCYLLKTKPLKLIFLVLFTPLFIFFLNIFSTIFNELNDVRFLQPLLFSETVSESNEANTERVGIWLNSIELVENPVYGVDLSLSNPYVTGSPLITESYFLSLYVNGGLLLVLLSTVTTLFLSYQSRSIYSLLITLVYLSVGLFVHVLYALSIIWVFVFMCRSDRCENFSNIGNHR